MFTLNRECVPYYRFLFDLRDSAICNMFESPVHLERRFPETKYLSQQIVCEWMDNCREIESSLKAEDEVVEAEDFEDVEEVEDGNYFAGTRKLQKEYERLYAKYVPQSGPADSEQGQLLRTVSKVYYRYFNDGDEDLVTHSWLLEESPIPYDIPKTFYKYFGNFNESALDKMLDIAVKYALEKEQMDKDLNPDVDAKHEERYTAHLQREEKVKEAADREKMLLSPIRKAVCECKVGELRSMLSKKNIREQKLTDSDIEWIVYGINDHMREVGESNDKRIPTGFRKTVAFLMSKHFFTKKAWYRTDLDNICKVYPSCKVLFNNNV